LARPLHSKPDWKTILFCFVRFIGNRLDLRLPPAQYVAKEYPDFFKKDPRPFPGKDMSVEEKMAREEIQKKTVSMEKLLYRAEVRGAEKATFLGKRTCGECDYFEPRNGDGMPKRVLPTAVPAAWLKHALFNHAAHRAVACGSCHERAEANHPRASMTSADVMLPGIDNCRQCHSPQTRVSGGVRGGARFDCVECHRYHNGDSPLQGIGAKSRGVPGPQRDLERFLSDPHRREPGQPGR